MKTIRDWYGTGAQDRNVLRSVIAADAQLRFDFVALTLAACAISTFGLLENNVAIIIGAMIIAPLILPIGSISFGAIEADGAIFREGLVTLAVGTGLSVVLAAVLARIVFLPTLGSEVMARSAPNLLDLGVAIAAGLVAAFAKIRPGIGGAIAGTAIAVALMPPICVAGIGLAHGSLSLVGGSALLYVTNLLGIMLASMAVYVVSGYVRIRRAQHGLVWTVAAIAAIVVPLGASTSSLVRQAVVESALRSALLNRTVTFARVELVRADFDWLSSPPTVNLLVRSREPITPTQVRLLEAFAKQKTGIGFQFVFDVSPIQEVRDVPAAPTQAPLYVPPQ